MYVLNYFTLHLIYLYNFHNLLQTNTRQSKSEVRLIAERKIQQIILTSPLPLSMSSSSQYEEGSDQNQELSEEDVSPASSDFTDDDSSDMEDEVQGILNAAHVAGILGVVNFRLDHLKMKKHMSDEAKSRCLRLQSYSPKDKGLYSKEPLQPLY